MARVAVVTGGTRGIGEAISVALKNAGYSVAANYCGNEERAKAFSDRTGIKSYKWDVASLDDCVSGVKKVESELGPVEVIVNNAGITRDGTLQRMSFEQWNEVIQTNLSSCFNMCRSVIEGMRARNFGRIVNIGSINGQAGQYGQVNYAAAKSGIHGFTKALAQEAAKFGITVNAIAPGYVETDMNRAFLRSDTGKALIARIPLGRAGEPQDLDGALLLLASDAGAYLNGVVLPVDGGHAVSVV
jgi:acetoacetyl-CoA reductase